MSKQDGLVMLGYSVKHISDGVTKAHDASFTLQGSRTEWNSNKHSLQINSYVINSCARSQRSKISFHQVTKWFWTAATKPALGRNIAGLLCIITAHDATSSAGNISYLGKMTTWQNHWVVLTYSLSSSFASCFSSSVSDLVLSKS